MMSLWESHFFDRRKTPRFRLCHRRNQLFHRRSILKVFELWIMTCLTSCVDLIVTIHLHRGSQILIPSHAIPLIKFPLDFLLSSRYLAKIPAFLPPFGPNSRIPPAQYCLGFPHLYIFTLSKHLGPEMGNSGLKWTKECHCFAIFNLALF